MTPPPRNATGLIGWLLTVYAIYAIVARPRSPIVVLVLPDGTVTEVRRP